MVAFLLQTTSSEDLCSEDSSWPIRTQELHTTFFSASNSSQERLVMERLLVCSPPQRRLSWYSYNDEDNSTAPGLVQRLPHHNTQLSVWGYCSGRTDVDSQCCHISCTTTFPASPQGPVKHSCISNAF